MKFFGICNRHPVPNYWWGTDEENRGCVGLREHQQLAMAAYWRLFGEQRKERERG